MSSEALDHYGLLLCCILIIFWSLIVDKICHCVQELHKRLTPAELFHELLCYLTQEHPDLQY